METLLQLSESIAEELSIKTKAYLVTRGLPMLAGVLLTESDLFTVPTLTIFSSSDETFLRTTDGLRGLRSSLYSESGIAGSSPSVLSTRILGGITAACLSSPDIRGVRKLDVLAPLFLPPVLVDP